MKFVLYPDLVKEHDKDIETKLENLTRDSQIVLPGGKTIPYWQTLQYSNRNFRQFITRFQNNSRKAKDPNDVSMPGPMDASEKTLAWEWNMLLRKILVTDCVKDYIETDLKYPTKFLGEHLAK